MRLTDFVSDQKFLAELEFMGSPCTKDCSGHRAGYNWGLAHGGVTTLTPSKSFDNGTYIAASVRRKRPQGGGKLPGYVSQTLAAKRKRAQRLAAAKGTKPIPPTATSTP